MLVVSPTEHFLEVQELQVNTEGMYWETVVAMDLPGSEMVSDGDLELFT